MRNFSQMIANLRDSENALYDALVETVGYVTFQYHANNRKTDGKGQAYWPQLVGAIQTKWIAEKIAKLEPKGKRLEIADETQAMLMVAPEISRILNERKQENTAKRIARNQAKADAKEAERKARVEAYEREQQADTMPEARVVADYVIAAKGVVTDLSEAEYQYVMEALTLFRMEHTLVLKAA